MLEFPCDYRRCLNCGYIDPWGGADNYIITVAAVVLPTKEYWGMVMYSYESCIRYSEVDEGRRITLASIVDYFQDVCTMQMEEAGIGLDYSYSRGQCWLLAAWQIEVLHYPVLGERIRVNTSPYGFDKFFCYRNFAIENMSSEKYVIANSIWLYYDNKVQRVIRISEDIIQRLELDEKLDMDYAPRKIKVPHDMEVQEKIVVGREHLDSNHHVNNSQYIAMAQRFIPDDMEVHHIRADYRRQAVLGDEIIPKTKKDEKQTFTVLLGGEKHYEGPYAIVSFA